MRNRRGKKNKRSNKEEIYKNRIVTILTIICALTIFSIIFAIGMRSIIGMDLHY